MEQNKQEPGVKLVLSGGKSEMDCATIPVQWFFSDEVIAQTPTWLVFIEQDEQEIASNNAGYIGQRYRCKVSEGQKFFQLFAPGKHRLAVLALTGDRAEGLSEEYLAGRRDRYDEGVVWSRLAENRDFSHGVVATTVVEFVVPAGLFAKWPKTKLAKAVWRWVNLWRKEEPRDECQYGKRELFAFTLKPWLWLIKAVAQYFILGPFMGVMAVAICIPCVVMAGYRPNNIFRIFKQAYLLEDVEIRMYREYRQWGYHYYLPVTPAEIAGLGLLGLGLYFLYPLIFIEGAMILLFAICVMATLIIIAIILNRFWPEEEIRPAVKEDEAAERFREWLRQWLAMTKAPTAVDLKNLPKPLGTSDKVVQFFKVSFWATKAKICKPYSKF